MEVKMSQFSNVFGRSANNISRSELGNFAIESWYGDDPLSFSPSLDDKDIDSAEWTTFEAILPGKKRPIVFHRDVEQSTIDEMVNETLEELGEDAPAAIRNQLTGIRQVIGVEFFPEELDDDSWEMLDLILAFLARKIDGLIGADDGIYDKELKKLIDI
ncbi:MAG: hypothetical protein LC808_03935 [Actinobacteria bacterium]|nr:hypothetical protein [Actinomycetota bacterium]